MRKHLLPWTLPENSLNRLVLHGAGGLGRRVASALRKIAHPALAFCDNNSGLWGREVEGLQVLSPAAATEAFPGAVFMVTIWHPSRTEGVRHHISELLKVGCKEVTCFIPLFWRYPDLFLPNLFWEVPSRLHGQKSLIDSARDLLDDAGKGVFDRQLRLHLEGDLLTPVELDPGLQYFPEGVIAISGDETFVDCGAYNGDTIRDFVRVSKNRFRRIVALEPDGENFDQLMSSILDDRVLLRQCAVGAKREMLRISSSGPSSSISKTGSSEVECLPLDELLAEESPTFVKMDIEGSEIAALHGAAATIQRCRPKLAVCVYHRPDDLWQIPLLLKRLIPESRLTLRSHMLDGFDTVCYCLPQS